MSCARRHPRGGARARARARPRPLRIEADRASTSGCPSSSARCGPTRRRSPTRRTRSSSAICGRRSSGSIPRPWWRGQRVDGRDGDVAAGATASSCRRRSTTRCSRSSTSSTSCGSAPEPDEAAGEIGLYDGGEVVGAFAPAHDARRVAARRTVLLENLCCKASGVHALRVSARRIGSRAASGSSTRSAAARRRSAIATSAAAARSRRRSRRRAGSREASGIRREGLLRGAGARADRRRRARRVGRVRARRRRGRRLAREARDEVSPARSSTACRCSRTSSPEWPCSSGPAGDAAPVIRLDAVGRHRIGSGSSQQALLTDIVVRPLEKLGRQDHGRRPLLDRAPRPGDHRAGGRRRRAGSQLPDARERSR